MYLRPIALGIATYIPGLAQLLARKGTGGTDSAIYCYEVWLKHLVLLWAGGMHAIPATLAELGPGDSLGVGIAAMLCGTNRYYGLDVVEHSSTGTNLAILDQLVELLRDRAPRSRKGWPDYDEHLDARLFPSHILTDALLERTLAKDRVERIRDALVHPEYAGKRDVDIRYRVPWTDEHVIEQRNVDVIVSHAVLQSVIDLDATYFALHAWLKPGGLMSHQIDFTCFRTSRQWNGHWSYSEADWKLILGRRSYLINREPHSTHLRLMKKHGFEVIRDLQNYDGRGGGIARSQLAERWRQLSDDDFACSGALIQARRPALQASSMQQIDAQFGPPI